MLLADTPEFKRAMRAAPPMHDGNQHRKWLQCSKCKRFQFYDYVPWSPNKPVHTPTCGHGSMSDLKPVAVIKQTAGKKRRTIERFGRQLHRGEIAT